MGCLSEVGIIHFRIWEFMMNDGELLVFMIICKFVMLFAAAGLFVAYLFGFDTGRFEVCCLWFVVSMSFFIDYHRKKLSRE
jgi:hypothetical protein